MTLVPWLSLWNTCEESNVLILIVIITDNGLSSQFCIIRPIELHVYICSEAHLCPWKGYITQTSRFCWSELNVSHCAHNTCPQGLTYMLFLSVRLGTAYLGQIKPTVLCDDNSGCWNIILTCNSINPWWMLPASEGRFPESFRRQKRLQRRCCEESECHYLNVRKHPSKVLHAGTKAFVERWLWFNANWVLFLYFRWKTMTWFKENWVR